MKLLYEDKIKGGNKEAFVNKVREISDKMGINPNWLMLFMQFESGLDSTKTNNIGCVGLIQFCPDKAGGNYKTIDGQKVYLSDLKKMSNVQQLDWVYRYFKGGRFVNKITRFHDLYLSILFPAAVGKSDDYVLQAKGLSADTVARQNPALSGGKNYITVADVKKKMHSLIPSGWEHIIGQKMDSAEKFVKRNAISLGTGLVLFGTAIALLYWKRDLFIKSINTAVR